MRPYQRRIIADKARLKGWVKSRQVGGSVGGTLDMVVDALQTHNDWNTMSRTGRQAKKLLRKAADHVEAIDFYLRTRLGQKTIIDKISTEEIVLKCGSVMAALPCDANTTVGDTVNWLLDEWALYPNSEIIFGTIKPSIMHGRRLLGLSTPRGRHGKFAIVHQNWRELGAESGWSFHITTIEDAIREGLVLRDHLGKVLTFEEFRVQEIRDIGLEMWLQEYMCTFLDTITAFLSWEIIQNCGVEGQTLVKSPEQLVQLAGPDCELYAGVDIGRRHDLTVIWIISRNPAGQYRTESIVYLTQTPFRTQEEVLVSYLRTGVIQHCCIDQMGIGMQLAENMQEDFGGIIEPVTFSNSSKLAMGEKLRVQMESGNFTFPLDDDIVEDFASVERVITDQGNVRIAATPGHKTHGDYFWAAAQALHGATSFGSGEVAIASA